MTYFVTKVYEDIGSICYRNHKADSHCNLLHGYSLTISFRFESSSLDVRNYVVDFGGLKPLKDKLEDWFDHTLLVACDDPAKEVFLDLHKQHLAKVVEVDAVGCEGIASFLFEYLNGADGHSGYLIDLLGETNVICTEVTVTETKRNSAGVTAWKSSTSRT